MYCKPVDSIGFVSDFDPELGAMMNRELTRQVCAAVDSCLTEQERQVIILRYGLQGRPPHRQREVAAVTGISRSYVSRIEKRALAKLKQALQ